MKRRSILGLFGLLPAAAIARPQETYEHVEVSATISIPKSEYIRYNGYDSLTIKPQDAYQVETFDYGRVFGDLDLQDDGWVND